MGTIYLFIRNASNEETNETEVEEQHKPEMVYLTKDTMVSDSKNAGIADSLRIAFMSIGNTNAADKDVVQSISCNTNEESEY